MVATKYSHEWPEINHRPGRPSAGVWATDTGIRRCHCVGGSIDPSNSKLDVDTPVNKDGGFIEGWIYGGHIDYHPFGELVGSGITDGIDQNSDTTLENWPVEGG